MLLAGSFALTKSMGQREECQKPKPKKKRKNKKKCKTPGNAQDGIHSSSDHKDDSPLDHVKVHEATLSVDALVAKVVSPRAGAISTFCGTTRDNFENKKVLELQYEGYVPMAEKELLKICGAIRTKWPDVINIAIEHRLGVCPVMESSVIIAIASGHRAASLEAVAFAIDTLKANVPIWKKVSL